MIRTALHVSFAVLLFSGTLPARGGERISTRAMGMAGTGVAVARGLDAVWLNPANLALQDGATVSLSILPVGMHVGTDFLDYDLYTRYFTGVEGSDGRVARYLTESDKQIILSQFEDGMGTVSADADLSLVGIALMLPRIGGFALTISERAAGFISLPRDYVDFLANGNPPESRFDFSKTDVRAAWTRSYTLTFGTSIPGVSFLRWFSAGASVKLVHGFAYYDVERFNTSLTTAANGVLTGIVDFRSRSSAFNRDLDAYSPLTAPAGTGVGLDLGYGGGINEYLSFGLSVTDLGSLRWTKHVEIAVSETTLVIDDPLRRAQRDAIEDVLDGRKEPAAPFTTSLPTTLRMGFALELHKLTPMAGEMLIALDYHQGLTRSPGTTTIPRFSLGVEYTPVPWLPLRTGISAGGTDAFNLALGAGCRLGAFEFDIASENVTWLATPGSFAYASVGVGMKLRF